MFSYYLSVFFLIISFMFIHCSKNLIAALFILHVIENMSIFLNIYDVFASFLPSI